MKLAIILSLLLASLPLSAQTPTNNTAPAKDPKASTDLSLPTRPNIPDANPEVLETVIQDQWDRGNDMFGGKQLAPPDKHGKTVQACDEEREAALRKLLAEGKVKSGSDFWFAALVFQHSQKPEALMLAHILATTAAAKGNSNGKWLAAASLDRYLWQIGQAQVFGTQFKKDSEGRWTMEPYAQGTLTDSERATWCVVSLAEQDKVLKAAQDGKPLGSTGVQDCK